METGSQNGLNASEVHCVARARCLMTKFSGQFKLMFYKKRYFTGFLYHIEIAQCDNPPRLLHGTRVIHGTREGGFVEYSCIKGYKLQGATRQTCLPSGEWSSTPPTCQSQSTMALPSEKNHSLSYEFAWQAKHLLYSVATRL